MTKSGNRRLRCFREAKKFVNEADSPAELVVKAGTESGSLKKDLDFAR